MSQFRWRGAVEHPDAVLSPAQFPGASQLPHRLGHRWTVRSDEMCEALMRQGQWYRNALRSDPSPAFGQVPQGQEQPVVDALVMGDRECDGQVMGPSGATGKEFHAQLRPRVHALDQAVIEDRETSRLEHGPSNLGMNV